MKKVEAKERLIKDIAIALVAWIVCGLIMCLMNGKFDFELVFVGFIFAGLPFGWRWMSKVVTATSILMIIIKGILSILLGWIAIFVVIIGDIIAFATAKDEEIVVLVVEKEDTEE